MARLAVLALALAAAGALCAAEKTAVLTVATFNLENYLSMPRTVDGRYRPDYPKPEREKEALRAAILAVRPDVLAVQEIGGASYLEELRRDLAAEGLEYPEAQVLDGPDPERRTGLLVRTPVVRWRRIPSLEFRYMRGREEVRRGLLGVTLPTAAGEVTVWTVHLKSRITERDDDPEAAECRTGEAAAVRDRLLLEHPDPGAERFLLVGDCNDLRNSAPLRRLQKRGGTVILRAVDAADPGGDRWTYHHASSDEYSRVDYILASPALFPACTASGIQPVPGGAGSDHRLVWARFSVLSLTRNREAAKQ